MLLNKNVPVSGSVKADAMRCFSLFRAEHQGGLMANKSDPRPERSKRKKMQDLRVYIKANYPCWKGTSGTEHHEKEIRRQICTPALLALKTRPDSDRAL